MALPRFSRPDQNILLTDGAVFVPSSEQTSMPMANALRTQGRWRTQPGWTIVANENDLIYFNRSGQDSAIVAAGYYATGTALATAIVTALEATDATPVWTCTYSARKFTIGSDIAFTLDFLPGGANGNSIALCLGYTATNKASLTSHVAEGESHQSRHAVDVDLGSAIAATFAAVRGSNFTTSATVILSGSPSPFTSVGYGFTGADYTATLTGTGLRSITFASQSKRYLRLIINDVSNSAGYVEIMALFVGTSSSLTVHPSVQYQKDKEHLGSVLFAEGGAHHTVTRARRRVYKLLFQLEEKNSLAVADRAVLDAIDALGIGTNFFATFDAPSESGLTVYGFNRVGLHEVYVQGTLWAVQMELAETVG